MATPTIYRFLQSLAETMIKTQISYMKIPQGADLKSTVPALRNSPAVSPGSDNHLMDTALAVAHTARAVFVT